MVKGFKLLLTLTLAFGITSFSNVQENSVVNAAIDATNVDTYYSSLYDSNGNIKYTGDTLLSKLNELISTDTTNKSYDYLDTIYQTSDVDPNDSTKVISYYSGQSISFDFDGFDSTKGGINREHVWPQSHFGKAENTQTSPYSDAHHVRPCEVSLNSSRSNTFFDELSSYSGSDAYGNVWNGEIFYPSEAYRGDAARICFYVATRYTNLSFVDSGTSSEVNGSSNYIMGNLSALLKWNETYAVKDSEIRRNEAVAKIQNNRNPFIDHPEFAEYIWGDGSYDGETSNTYTVTFNTNGGSSISPIKVEENSTVNKPTDPTKEGYSFGGWYSDSSLTTPYNFSNLITGNITLYAAWEEETSGDDTPITTSGWVIVKDASTLKAGDKIVLASSSKGVVAGALNSSILDSVSSTFSTEMDYISSLSDDALQLTLGGSAGTWTLSNSYGNLLGATAVKKLAWDAGTTTWTISISDGNATISNTNSSYGRFLYNVNSPRFTTYTSSTSAVMLLPQIYKYVKTNETTPDVPAYDLKDFNVETALSFSYVMQENEPTSSKVFDGTGAFDAFNGSATTNFKYGSKLTLDETTIKKVSSAFGLKTFASYLRPAKSINDESDYSLLLGSSSEYGVITFDNIAHNATTINVDLAGWNTSSSVTLTNATYNGSDTITFTNKQVFETYKLTILDSAKEVTLSSNTTEKRTFVDNIQYICDITTTSYSFDNFLMRYKVNIDKDVFDSIGGVSYGALINAKENNPSYSNMTVIDFDNKYTQANNYLNIEISSNQIVENESTYTLSAALKGIPNTDLEKEVVTVFYIKTATNVYFTNSKTYSVSSLVDEYLTKHLSILTEEEIKILNALDASIN